MLTCYIHRGLPWNFHCVRCSQPSWKIGPCFLHFPSHLSFPPWLSHICSQLQVSTGKAPGSPTSAGRPFMGAIHIEESAKWDAPSSCAASRPAVVGQCQYFLCHWCGDRLSLDSLEMGSQFQSWTLPSLQHWLGWGCCSRAQATHCNKPQFSLRQQYCRSYFSSAVRQHRNCLCHQQKNVVMWFVACKFYLFILDITLHQLSDGSKPKMVDG